MRILVSFSGGKDSQAALIHTVEKYGCDKVEAVFCDTGWEHPWTYEHVSQVANQLHVKLTTLKSQKYDGFVDLAIKRKRFPSTKRRFCTAELKIKPMIDYVLSIDDSIIMVQGIRAKESAARENGLRVQLLRRILRKGESDAERTGDGEIEAGLPPQ